MSNPDSFIDEVTEEVRRDRLFAAMRKYGWIGLVLVAAVVGGTAWQEWQKSERAAQSRAFGDAILKATESGTADERRAALAAIPAAGEQKAVLDLLLASDPEENPAATLEALRAIEADLTLPQLWRDLAVLRRVGLQGKELPLSERRAALEPLAVPGRVFRPMAAEQLAYLLVEEGKSSDAITALQALTQDQDAPGGLRNRAAQMIVALGGVPEQG
ncbi:hypothetical protein [Gemmobacter serpentinus]|uniref:hypothetical protein n=1 Tax=Gemmobacter serpentinus TaxID=2652247 RepID=UPI00124C8627|nr:hypothetical protein [Gemmobacter serpentinus]